MCEALIVAAVADSRHADINLEVRFAALKSRSIYEVVAARSGGSFTLSSCSRQRIYKHVVQPLNNQ